MSAATYSEFLDRKARSVTNTGIDVRASDLHPNLFKWQAEVTAWAARKGRAAVFADCGLGKTFIQLEWARVVADRTLVLAPLSVARQTVREAAKINSPVTYVRSGDEVDSDGVWITNYEMADRFNPSSFGALVLDESSILKSVDGKTRQRLTQQWSGVRRRLACTATPAPNDITELCNHAEFLGVMSRSEMLAHFFVNDQQNGHTRWRLKGHARERFYEWLASWAVALRRPSDLGWSDDGYDLPPLRFHAEVVETDIAPVDGQMFPVLGGVGGRAKVRKATASGRIERAIELAHRPGQWIVWCGLNLEADAVARSVGDAINVEGSMSPDAKAEALEAFQDGSLRVLVTKPSIAGWGMNFQNAHHMAFVGLSDSYESYYQAVRRCWRFGQTQPVDVHIIVSHLERQIVENVRAKERTSSDFTQGIIRHSEITKSSV